MCTLSNTRREISRATVGGAGQTDGQLTCDVFGLVIEEGHGQVSMKEGWKGSVSKFCGGSDSPIKGCNKG